MAYEPPTDLELGIEVTLKVILFTVGCVVTVSAPIFIFGLLLGAL